MKEQIKRNLNNIQELEDKKLLKDIMQYVFNGMIDYTDAVYDRVQRRVFEEINLDDKKRYIYTTVCEKEHYDNLDDFMFPMFQEDLKEDLGETDWIVEKQNKQEEIILGQTFLCCDYLQIKEITEKAIPITGRLITDKTSYHVTIQLKQSRKYIEKVEDLYYNYKRNNLQWTTVNAPYLYKFFDYVVVDMESVQEGEVIKALKLSLGEWESYRNDTVIPLWNLEEGDLTCSTFPIATGNSLKYQHNFKIPEMESIYENIIRFHKEYDGYVIRDHHSISIILPEEDISTWPAYKVHEPNLQIEYEYGYDICSNAFRESFLAGYTRQQPKVIRTKAELIRQLNAFEISDLFKIEEVEIVEQYDGLEETYPINTFIEDEIRSGSKRKIMLVVFQAKEDSYLLRDIMSFILSEVQQSFPEYKCLGRLVP